jgi:uncharacterized protein YuzE
MKTRYDPEVDALYVRFAEAKIVESEEVRPGVVLDFDAEGASSVWRFSTPRSIWREALT